jgi:hypothetical protein
MRLLFWLLLGLVIGLYVSGGCDDCDDVCPVTTEETDDS